MDGPFHPAIHSCPAERAPVAAVVFRSKLYHRLSGWLSLGCSSRTATGFRQADSTWGGMISGSGTLSGGERKQRSFSFHIVAAGMGCQPWQESLKERKDISHNALQIFARNVSIRGNLAGKLKKHLSGETSSFCLAGVVSIRV